MLLKKLRDYDFDENAIKWFVSYLTDRQQYVVYQNAQSDLEYVTNGVPQGSVLGPTLFCLYYNTIVHSFTECDPFLYADDTEVHHSNKDLALAQAKINIDLMNVDQWLLQNRMIANVKKTKSLLIGSKPAIKKAGKLEVRLSDESVEQLDSFDYLGLRVSNCLS